MDSPMRRLPVNGFLNCYELDELRQEQEHYPNWLENDESDDLIFEDALYGVI